MAGGQVRVVLSADDPDLREYGHNFGYEYYFAWKAPFLHPPDWDCACPIVPDISTLLGGSCVAWGLQQPLISFDCRARSIEHVILQGMKGTVWTGAFIVGEVKGLVFGLASTGTFILTVNNKRPELSVAFSVVRVRPGETVSAVVTATDPDRDVIILTKVSGLGTFPLKVEGKGIVSGTYSWTVPKDYAYGPSWEIVTFRADDGFGGVGLASLVIRIERPLLVYDARVHVRTCPRGIARTAIHVDDGDPSPIPLDSPLFTLGFQPPAGISVVERPESTHNVSLLLGAFVAKYRPDGADGFCRVVREREVIVDEFTVILRGPCKRGLDAGRGRWATLQRARVARNLVAEGPREGYPAAGPGRRLG